MNSESLQTALTERGVIVEDLAAFWMVAEKAGKLTRGKYSVYATLRARFTAQGQPNAVYQEIAKQDDDPVSKTAVWTRIARALDYMARPTQVVHYGRYVDVQTIAQQAELMEA